jgi:hypothetical protein
MPTPRFRSLASILAAALALAACERAARPSTPPLVVTAAQFQSLRWLEGTWRGSGGGFDGFYEGYRWLDDSTIRKFDFADSTLAVISDSGDITLRGGTVRSGSAASSYVVTALDSVSVHFAPERNVSNAFEWRLTAAGAWTARLTWDSAGVPRERVYEMRAYRPPGAP